MKKWQQHKPYEKVNMSFKWQSITLLCLKAVLTNVYKYQENRAVNDCPPQHSESLTPIIHNLEQEAGQLPVHFTSFPPFAVTVLFILCFFLYALCSHVDFYKHPRCLSRIESIHHEHFKWFASLSELNSLSLSHLSWFPCVREAVQSSLAHTGTHQYPRVSVFGFPRMHSCFSVLRLLETLSLCR